MPEEWRRQFGLPLEAMSYRALVVSNARAGQHRQELVDRVAARLRDAGWELTLAATTSPEEAKAEVGRHARSGGNAVIAIGGDGTVHSVLQGLDLERQTLGIIPLGSGNDVYRNTHQASDPESTLAPLLADRTQMWDLGEVGGIRFLNSAGVGLDAHTLETRESTSGWIRRNYSALFLLTLSRFRPFAVRLTIDGVVHERRGWWFIVANSPWIGGGMFITPGGTVTDGRFDILTVGGIGKLNLVQLLPKVFRGSHVGTRGVEILYGHEILLETPDGPERVAVDGELAMETPVTFRMRAGLLRVFAEAPTRAPLG